jgi:hypothetical protein
MAEPQGICDVTVDAGASAAQRLSNQCVIIDYHYFHENSTSFPRLKHPPVCGWSKRKKPLTDRHFRDARRPFCDRMADTWG